MTLDIIIDIIESYNTMCALTNGYSSKFRRSYVQKVLYSEGSMFRRSYVQKYLFRRSYVQKVGVTTAHDVFATLKQRQ